MDQRFLLRTMDAEGRTVSLVPDYEKWRVAPVFHRRLRGDDSLAPTPPVADFEASEETLRQRLGKMAAAAEEPTS